MVIALAVVLVALVWLGIRTVIVKGELERAQDLINRMQTEEASVRAALPLVGEHAGSAASVKFDPVWRAAEFVPFAGDNLRAVRYVAETLDVFSNDIGGRAFDEINSDSDDPILQRMLPVLDDSKETVERLADGVAGITEAPLLAPPVRTGALLADQVLTTAAPAFEYGPELLGANGKRTYLLVFQNNAESVGLGGSAASQTLITADNGAIEIARQASSGDFVEGQAVDVDVPQSALDLYNEFLITHVNTTPSRPDFPTMAELVTAFWQRDIDDSQIDGVVSIDPIALQAITAATGPITVEGGITIDETNAVQMLLVDAYAQFTPEEADVFFAGVASEVFNRIASGAFDMQKMLPAIQTGIDGGNILFHSSNPDLQAQVASERVSGILPTDNEDATTLGVFFRDESASKIDSYMRSNIDVIEQCDGRRTTFEAVTTLHLDIDPDAAAALPDYVRTQNWPDEQRYRTQVYVYGPPGTAVESVQVRGAEVSVRRDDAEDLGRPVAWFETYLRPSEVAEVRATFAGDGDFGPTEIRSTPMVRATTGAVTACG